jgi:hypothetical protein
VVSAIRFLTTQDARVRGDSDDEVPMEPTMYGRLATAMTPTVSRRHGTPDGDDGDNEPMWSLELASSWARLDAVILLSLLPFCFPSLLPVRSHVVFLIIHHQQFHLIYGYQVP